MKQVLAKRIGPFVALVTVLLLAGTADAQETHPLWACADKVAGALRDYTVDASHLLLACEKKRREKTTAPADCATDPDVVRQLDGYATTFRREVEECYQPPTPIDQQPGRALCAIESRSLDVLVRNVTSGDAAVAPDSVRLRIVKLVRDLFVTPVAGCARPSGVVSSNSARTCANLISQLGEEKTDETDQCFFSCEKDNLSSTDACVDDEDGQPEDDGVLECIAEKTGPAEDLQPLTDDCSNQDLVALGCPLGENTVDGFVEAFSDRIAQFAEELNFDTFHSSCRTSLAGPPIEIPPANVTLFPSFRTAQVSYGQVLDAAFFGSDTTVRFDSDLNCVDADTAVNGIVVAKSRVTIDGKNKTAQISGPGSRRLRSGAGILVAPGARKVKITNFRRIQNFGVGVQDSGDNVPLRVMKTTFFRNIFAGVRSTSRKTMVVDSTFDRNGIGVHLAGDNSEVKNKIFIRRSEPQTTDSLTPLSPGYGILASGDDVNGDGRAVRVNNVTLDDNRVGVVVEGNGHVVQNSRISQATETPPADARDGIQVLGSSNDINSNSIKFNTGACIVVSGDLNQLEANRCEDNSEEGFVVAGTGNVLENNNAGAPGHGNGLAGYVIGGAGNVLDSNRAEGNGGAGFVVETSTARFKGNRAEGNGGKGFHIVGSGNGLETNSASANGGFEFDIASGNADLSGNKANGSSFSFGAGAITRE
jgi:hypothetical protein